MGTTTARLVHLEFIPDQDLPLLRGSITATLRPRLVARPGDQFYAGRTGMRCTITAIRQVTVGPAGVMYYNRMGFQSPEQFFRFWREIHPYIGCDLAHKAFLYEFKCLGRKNAGNSQGI